MILLTKTENTSNLFHYFSVYESFFKDFRIFSFIFKQKVVRQLYKLGTPFWLPSKWVNMEYDIYAHTVSS